ncbi:SRPBCC family protein [Glycomyces niveus]|uniref:SRPBCC family protein n=1 Tax=Glycomyces niveus TaxID=2820287 RepID=A0ABS3U2C1_9ACTN|nr:SRPBCC family protein [Glycomyces sp. NEAU-S30]MBO3731837.1 SRPBCC family protein [Glycomyces sp. NEAU-S30]
MGGDAFVYLARIKTTPRELWRALTEPQFTERYWGLSFDTDWAPGSPMTWAERGGSIADPGQRVLEADPPRRLAYTWHTFTPEWAERARVGEDALAAIAAEPRSQVAFDLEPGAGTVRLKVTHDGFEPGSRVRGMVVEGWPELVSSLKTLLETGEPLPG